jgi:Fe-S-cluster containining protein
MENKTSSNGMSNSEENKQLIHDHAFILNIIKIIRDREPAKAAMMIQQIFDGIYNEMPDTDCANGCSWCCNSRVFITRLEAKAIEAHIRHRFKKDQVDTVVDRSKKIKKKFQKLTKDERLIAREPCPLLFDGRCSIYSSRPLSCRSTFSTSSKACEAGDQDPMTNIPIILGPKNMSAEMTAAILMAEGKQEEYELTIPEAILKKFK